MARLIWLALLVQVVASFTTIPRPRLPGVMAMRGGGSDMAGQLLGATLRDACSRGDDDSAQAVLEAGAEPDSTDVEGQTALMAACDGGHEACAQALLQAGADADLATPDGSMALLRPTSVLYVRAALTGLLRAVRTGSSGQLAPGQLAPFTSLGLPRTLTSFGVPYVPLTVPLTVAPQVIRRCSLRARMAMRLALMRCFRRAPTLTVPGSTAGRR